MPARRNFTIYCKEATVSVDAAMVAEVLPSEFELVTKLAATSLSSIWLADDRRRDRPVAVKLLQPALVDDLVVRERFRREAVWGMRLHSAYIVHTYGYINHPVCPAIVMEYLPGNSLKRVIHHQPLDSASRRRFGINIVSAVADLHRFGLIHRDVKPQNFIQDVTGRFKLTDFGIAFDCRRRATEWAYGSTPLRNSLLLRSSLTLNGQFLGTPDYISPEQARGELVDERTDLYSLGVVLYEMAVGQLPFLGNGSGPMSVIREHIYQEPASLRGKISRSWRRLIGKAMSKPRAGRYQHAEELKFALRGVKD
jgi:serine/threonine protein kinase